MANEITAEMLAREMRKIKGLDDPRRIDFNTAAETFMIATRALASLQAERANDVPERVRCWITDDGDMTTVENTAVEWRAWGHTVTEGYFTAKGSTDD